LAVNGALAVVSLLFALGICELGLRWFGNSSRAAGLLGGMKSDPDCGFVPYPNLVLKAIPGVFPEIRTNSWGMRDQEYTRQKPPGVFRILALGDSFAYGRVDIAFNFLTLLEKQANQKLAPQRVEILNAGVPAYQPVHELAYLKKYGLAFAPNLVLLCFYVGNDLRENDRSPNELDPTNPIRESKEQAERLPFYSLLSWSELYWSVTTAITKARLLSDIRQRIPESRPSKTDDPRRIRPDFAFMSPRQYREALKAQMRNHLNPPFRNDWDRNNFAATQKVIAAMAQIGRDQNMVFAVVLLPSEVQVDPDVRNEFLHLADGVISPEEMDFTEPQKTLTEIFQSMNIPIVDLLPDFVQAGREKRLYLLRDTHWNEEGNTLAAKLLLEPVIHGIQTMEHALK